jgi:transposase-like protein
MSRSTDGRIRKAYTAWRHMLARCSNPRDPSWKNYGGRGIKVCKQWDSFEVFYTNMGDCPTGKSLDRINNNKSYSKENCRWATASEQTFNRRPYARTRYRTTPSILSKLKELQKRGLTTRAAAEEVGLSKSLVHRIYQGIYDERK